MVLFFVAVPLWLRVLSELELSVAYPILSLSYALSLVVDKWFFQGELSLTRIIGVACIMLGALIVSRS